MSIKKTLGGDRLGSGNKMKVEMHGYERSTHDLGYIWRSTMSAGTLVPFMKLLALPGDTFDIDLDCDIKTHPTVGPLFGSYKVQLDIFEAPIRLYQSLLHNNMLGIGMDMSKVKLPIITLEAQEALEGDTGENIDTSQINPSSILAYLGIRGIGYVPHGMGSQERNFNATPLLAYWEIYKQYYANKAEKLGAVIHAGLPAMDMNIIDPVVYTSYIPGVSTPISIDVYEMQSGNAASGTAPITPGTQFLIDVSAATNPDVVYFQIVKGNVVENVLMSQLFSQISFTGGNLYTGIPDPKYYGYHVIHWRYITYQDNITVEPKVTMFDLDNLDDYRKAILAHSSEVSPFDTNSLQAPIQLLLESSAAGYARQYSQEGLAIKTYQSDIFNNWLDTASMTYVSNVSAVSTAGGSFTIDQLNLSKKVYEMLNRIAVSGGTYDDWLDVQYAHERYTRAESPIYHGGLIKELVFQEVVSNAQAEDQKLGTLAGKGVMAKKHKGGKVVIRVNEPSYLIGIISLTPRIDYSQGNDWDIHLRTIADFHVPAMDEIGFQDLITEQMAWWDTQHDGSDWQQHSAGKQPAWLNYMTNYNKTYGNFAMGDPGEMFMTLNRRYEPMFDSKRIEDLTTYIDPVKCNYIFAETALDAQNFWTQIAVDITARRKMSAKVMPNL